MTGISTADFAVTSHRLKFPALENKAYFNYGGQGPLPHSAIAAIQQSFQQVQQLGPFSGQVNTWIVEQAHQTRRAIATELSTTPETITLTEDVSMGCNIALWGIDWQAGDHLLLSDCEHPGIVAAAQEIQRRLGVEVSTCPLQATLNLGDSVMAVTQQLRPTTRLVVLSHILWNTGQVLPLADITAACHAYSSKQPIRVLVDAAQSVGVLPLNLPELEVDFYAFTGHKWWCGPEGVGGLYVHPDALESLHPTFIGWRGITTNLAGQPTGWKPNSQRYEIATSAYPLYAGLQDAIALHHQFGTAQERYQRIQVLSRYLWQQLADLPGVICLRDQPPEAGLVSFQLPDKSHPQIVKHLEEQQIMTRTILQPNCIRACVHYFTLESEIDRLVESVRAFVKNPT